MNAVPIPVFVFLAGFIAVATSLSGLFLLGVVVKAFREPVVVQPWQISYVDAQAAEAARRGEAL